MCCTRKPGASKYYVGSWDSLILVENMRPLTPGSGNGFPPCSHLGFVSLIMTPATKFESVIRSWEQTQMLPVSGFKIKSLRRTLRCDNLVNLNSVILIRYLGITGWPVFISAYSGSTNWLKLSFDQWYHWHIMKTRRLIMPYINISRKNIRGLSCDLFDYECQNVQKKRFKKV